MPRLPTGLTPTAHLVLTTPSGAIEVPVCRPTFRPWRGAPAHTFGGKDLLEVDGRPQFAEVAILRLFEQAGWQGRWVETYGHGKLTPGLWRDWHPDGPRAQTHHPIEAAWVRERLHAIAMVNGNSYSGCWDVVAWSLDASGTDRLVFAESKKAKHDRMRSTQVRWLEAAMECGMKAEDFLVVEWVLVPSVEH